MSKTNDMELLKQIHNYDPELSPYKGVVGNEHRIVKQTLRDGTVRFSIQVSRVPFFDWSTLTQRSTYEEAMEAIDFLTGKMVNTEEVVYDSSKSN